MIKLTTVILWVSLIYLSGCSVVLVSPENTPAHTQQPGAGSTGVSAVDRLIAKGDEQRRRGEYGHAAATLERALRLSPGSGSAYLALSRVRLDQKHYLEAQQLAEKSLSLSGNSSQVKKAALGVISKAKAFRDDLNSDE